MNSWIQTSDFDSTDQSNVTVEDAIKMFCDYDWGVELQKEEESKSETCNPGFGLVCNSGSILHICPRNDNTCFVNYDHSVKKKLLGFIPITSTKTHYIDTVTFEEAQDLIKFHYLGSKDKILEFK